MLTVLHLLLQDVKQLAKHVQSENKKGQNYDDRDNNM